MNNDIFDRSDLLKEQYEPNLCNRCRKCKCRTKKKVEGKKYNNKEWREFLKEFKEIYDSSCGMEFNKMASIAYKNKKKCKS